MVTATIDDVCAKHSLEAWQRAVLLYLLEPSSPRKGTAYNHNLEHGLRVNWGKKSGHTHLAMVILKEFPDACVVVPTDNAPGAPYADKARMVKRDPSLADRIWVSRHLDAGDKQDVIDRTFEPLKSSRICIVDCASRLSEWELAPVRCGEWDKYVELG